MMKLDFNKKLAAFLMFIAIGSGSFNFCFLHPMQAFAETENQIQNLDLHNSDSCAQNSEAEKPVPVKDGDSSSLDSCCFSYRAAKTETVKHDLDSLIHVAVLHESAKSLPLFENSQITLCYFSNNSPPEPDVLFSVFKKE